MCDMTPLSIGFEKLSKHQYHTWLQERCEQIHSQIEKNGRYGYHFFSGSHFMYIVKFHHDDTYDVYRRKG